MNWNKLLFTEMTAFALLAPSVHNVQPWKVQFTEEGFNLFQAKSRRLHIGDPKLHDNDVSLGAFIELASLFLKNKAFDLSVSKNEAITLRDDQDEYQQRFFIKIIPTTHFKDHLYDEVKRRKSYRGLFTFDPLFNEQTLRDINVPGLEIKWITGPLEMKKWADLYDHSSGQINQIPGYFKELLHWLRLSKSHPKFHEDGLNYKALSLGWAEAFLGRLLFRESVFKLLTYFSLEKILITEAPQIKSAQGIIIIYANKDLTPLEMGRSFVRLWLCLSSKNLSVCPLSSLVDFSQTLKILNSLKSSDATICLNVLRFGKVANEKNIYSSPRLSAKRITLE